MKFFEQLLHCTGNNVKFIIESVCEGDNFAAVVMWHLESQMLLKNVSFLFDEFPEATEGVAMVPDFICILRSAGETPFVVVITSGKGGVGKTTTTANVGLSLARLGFTIVAIDADVSLRNLDLLLGLENRVNYTAVEVLNGDSRIDQALIRDKRWSNFELLCISKPRSKIPLGFGGKALIWLVEALKSRLEGSPDFILIDCPAGIDAGFITAITPAKEAVLVTTPDITSLRDADRVIGLLECDGIKDIKMIVNRVRTDLIRGEDMMSVLDVQEMLGLVLSGLIPEDSEYKSWVSSCFELAGLAFEQAGWRLVEQDSMKAVMVEEEPKKPGFFSFFGG
ncbi:hypothetical protein HHK36_001195 [Tetracentron sinense]|uniref:CobQ/CobB/MinD/ParA nucleotide binding domain-containing protein n=1 Tax=Tetracentron sinense TaxID=13715 RepID=A0A834ZSF3_TETSI|nr:hypothetical protein HHK36_001195 [Tetracentron sinense]